MKECECNLSFGIGIGIGKISVTTLIWTHAHSIVPDCIAVDADIVSVVAIIIGNVALFPNHLNSGIDYVCARGFFVAFCRRRRCLCHGILYGSLCSHYSIQNALTVWMCRDYKWRAQWINVYIGEAHMLYTQMRPNMFACFKWKWNDRYNGPGYVLHIRHCSHIYIHISLLLYDRLHALHRAHTAESGESLFLSPYLAGVCVDVNVIAIANCKIMPPCECEKVCART